MAMDGEARERLIIWLRKRMDEYGIKLSDLKDKPVAQAPALAMAPKQGPAKYRDAKGHTWDGSGARPDWLNHAVSLGLSPSFFEVTPSAGRQSHAHV
jgi:DNA-binding protein H-NS